MRATIVSRDTGAAHAAAKIIGGAGWVVAREDPDVVFSIGGDGTLLVAERLYPGIPKISIRLGSICRSCVAEDVERVLEKLERKALRFRIVPKARAIVRRGGRVVARRAAANDIVIRNSEAFHALRFAVSARGKNIDVIGDGLVYATAFGSTGYFHSVSRKRFGKGFGLAFNNTVEKRPPLLGARLAAKVTIERNRAVLCSDNNRSVVQLIEGDVVELSPAKEQLVVAEGFF